MEETKSLDSWALFQALLDLPRNLGQKCTSLLCNLSLVPCEMGIWIDLWRGVERLAVCKALLDPQMVRALQVMLSALSSQIQLLAVAHLATSLQAQVCGLIFRSCCTLIHPKESQRQNL